MLITQLKAKETIEDSLEILDMESDEELKELAKEELNEAKKDVETIEEELKILLLPKDPNDQKNVIVEIRAGAGGDEAALFAAEVYRMYVKYAESLRWKTDMMSLNENGIGGFKEVEFPTEAHAKRTRFFITTVVVIVVVPSVLSAISMIRENAVAQNAPNFVTENKVLEHSYIYDYKVDTKSRDGKLALYIAGDALTATDRARLMATAPHYGIDTTRIQFIQHKSQDVADGFSEELFREVYQQANDDLVQKEEQLMVLQEELLQYRRDEIPHSQISKEIFAAYPNIKDVSISRGVAVSSDSLKQKDCIMVMTKGAKNLTRDEQKKLEDWLAARLNESDIRLIHTVSDNRK